MKKRARLIFYVLLFLLWFIYFRPQFLGGPASYIIVSGISMEPTLKSGDLTILQKQDRYQPGDVIAYRADGGQVIHRIIDGDNDGYFTQGDNKQVIDPWKPTVDDILGKMWFFIPRAGTYIHFLRQPMGLAGLGLLGSFLVFNEPLNHHRRKRGSIGMGSIGKDNTDTSVEESQEQALQGWKVNHGSSGWFKKVATVLFVIFGIVLTGAFYLGYLGFGKAVEETQPVNVLTYVHSGSFVYTVNVQPSTLYPNGTVESPKALTPEIDSVPTSTVVFSQLAKSIDIGFHYKLMHDQPTEVEGELYHVLEIWDYETLLKSEPLAEKVLFSGTEVSGRVSLDFVQLQNMIAAIQEEIGYSHGTYKVKVASIVLLSGAIGERTIEEKFTPSLSFQYDSTQVSIENNLAVTEEKTIQEELSVPQQVTFLGSNLPVIQARTCSLFLGLFSLVITCVSAGVLFLGWWLPEDEKIQARYGNMIINVAKTRLQNNPAVRAASIEDLARVAERTGNVICHIQQLDDVHFYFVPDTQVIFTYATGRKHQEGKVECGDS